jgi:hypothetical protein
MAMSGHHHSWTTTDVAATVRSDVADRTSAVESGTASSHCGYSEQSSVAVLASTIITNVSRIV